MKKEENILYLDENIEFTDCEELIESLNDVDKVSVQTNDIHPSALQLLLSVSKDKEIIVEDDFYRRFFENLHFSE